ncbi:MAG: Hpt domain-containing protein [Gammaproteobacteria bacterium]|nr:Hpt domain-containing protein [Gammaproteobacteria bacterium]
MSNIVDVELALQRAAGRRELAQELHGMLLGSMDETRRAIEASWQSGDHNQLYVHVHKLNGSTRYCGVPHLERCCEELEKQLRVGDDTVQDAYHQLINAIDALEQTPADFS